MAQAVRCDGVCGDSMPLSALTVRSGQKLCALWLLVAESGGLACRICEKKLALLTMHSDPVFGHRVGRTCWQELVAELGPNPDAHRGPLFERLRVETLRCEGCGWTVPKNETRFHPSSQKRLCDACFKRELEAVSKDFGDAIAQLDRSTRRKYGCLGSALLIVFGPLELLWIWSGALDMAFYMAPFVLAGAALVFAGLTFRTPV
jgi:hypothetical protein